jgi:hypothetical protein
VNAEGFRMRRRALDLQLREYRGSALWATAEAQAVAAERWIDLEEARERARESRREPRPASRHRRNQAAVRRHRRRARRMSRAR